MKQPIKIGTCLLFAAAAIMLAGCGSHDQNSPNNSQGGTPSNIVDQAKQSTQGAAAHPPSGGQTAPAGH